MQQQQLLSTGAGASPTGRQHAQVIILSWVAKCEVAQVRGLAPTTSAAAATAAAGAEVSV